MGSTLTLTGWTADESAAKRAFHEVFAEFTRLETLMSTWIADSDVSRVNRKAGVRAVPVSAEVRRRLPLIERLPDIEGVIVSDKNEVLISSGLKNTLTIVAPPTDAP